MHIFQVTAKVSTLSESFLAFGTSERALASVLPEVVPQIAALFKYRATCSMTTFEVQLDAHRVMIFHFDSLVPVARNTLKCLRFGAHGVLTPSL